MSRVLKFRAWDKVAKKFLHPYPDGFHLLGETTCFDLIGMQLKERSPEKATLEMLNDVEITQYIGLKDKNGKEIYENDVTIFDVKEGGEREPPLKQLRGLVKCYHLGLLTFGGKFSRFIENIEIIGDIYQNPELLKKAEVTS